MARPLFGECRYAGEMSAETAEHRWFAWFYDHMAGVMEHGPLGRLRSRLLADLEGDVLEIGAGTGSNFRHYGAAARVVAFEPDPHMLKRARGRATANIDVRQAPAERLPVADASFDAVASTLVLCTVGDVRASLVEVRRVLRAGGKLVFIEHVRGGGLLGRVQDAVQPVYGWFAAGCQANRDTEQALRDAGFAFEHIEHTKLSPVMPAIYGVATVEAR